MKKILFVMLLAIIGLSASAREVTGRAYSLRSEVVSFLRSEGYAPSIDNDGDIKFKVEGKVFYISFDNWGNYVYVNTYSTLSTEGESMYKVRQASDIAQKAYKFVRCNVYDSSISISVTFPIKTISEYKSLFPDAVDIIQSTKSKLKEAYNE